MMLIRHGTQAISFGPLPKTYEEEWEAYWAGKVGEKLLGLADGRDTHDPETWLSVAKEVHCKCVSYDVDRASLGEYCPTRRGSGCITYNKAVKPFTQARVLVHELAHHLLMLMGIMPWPEKPFRIAYGPLDGTGHNARHRMSRQAERIVFGF